MTTTKTKDTQWYAAKTGNHQGLVIEEGTGRNVAVAYDKKDTPLLAAAPALLYLVDELQATVRALTRDCETCDLPNQVTDVLRRADSIIADATGKE
jgi:hypothetical protein